MNNVRFGPWSCENALSVALTRGDDGRGDHVWWVFCLEVLLKRVTAVLGGSAMADGCVAAGDYALIAARSGWTPMMFMTRVRL